MGKGDLRNQEAINMSHVLSMNTCPEGHKKQHPGTSVNGQEFSMEEERKKAICDKGKGC